MSVVDQALRVADESDGILAIVGPTASGKTALAVSIAERVGGEIVGADSIQVYRGFDVGSGKPSAEELLRAPHHLVGALDPLEPFDAASWAASASRAIAEIRSRGRTPIVCGGTFLWIKALLFGLAQAPGGDGATRARHREIAELEGRTALHARLRSVDHEAAERLHPNDFVRVSRALEVFEISGRTLTSWQREHGFARSRCRARLVAIAFDQAQLTERIRRRVAWCIEQGWIEEVQTLLARGYGDARAMGSVGYSQVRAAIEGTLARDDMSDAIVRATRVFARRQRTWLRHADVTWLAP